mmetsp:Transcript_5932/g.11430  ORF Transcript_5932/g.11430 Transcript_5932/m.11430 type:complete len:201 (+) Transcript_5932:3069-3671(+)
MANGAGANSLVFRCNSQTMAFIRSSLRVLHWAMAQDICDRLCAVKVEILLRQPAAMALTRCSFQRPLLAKAQAVLESCLWSNPSILRTTSAAITDISDSVRIPSDAKPRTMTAMSPGVNKSTWRSASSATLLSTSTATGSCNCSSPIAKARSASSRGQIEILSAYSWPYSCESTSFIIGLLRTAFAFSCFDNLTNTFRAL